jgi:hypothetical protein
MLPTASVVASPKRLSQPHLGLTSKGIHRQLPAALTTSHGLISGEFATPIDRGFIGKARSVRLPLGWCHNKAEATAKTPFKRVINDDTSSK